MTPLERAARALCSLDGNPENATMEGKPLWRDYLPEARAVVEALREPSDTMVLAAEDHCDSPATGGYGSAGCHWALMIETALAEQP